MRIWQGETPDGYPLLVEREDHGPWVVTVAAMSRSRNNSLEAALLEAGGGSVPREWAARVAAAVLTGKAEADSEPRTHHSCTKPS